MNDQAIWSFVWIPISVASVLIVRNIVLSFIVPHPLLQRLSQPEAHKDPLVQELLLAWLFARRL